MTNKPNYQSSFVHRQFKPWQKKAKNGTVWDNFGVILDNFGVLLDKFGNVLDYFGSTKNTKKKHFQHQKHRIHQLSTLFHNTKSILSGL